MNRLDLEGSYFLSTSEQTTAVLEELGLGKVQARIYTIMARSGVSNARALAKNAKVATQDVYRLLNELIDLGLVMKIIGKPTMYVPLPLHEGLSLLLKRRKEKFSLLEDTVLELAETSKLTSNAIPSITGEFLFVPQKEPCDKMVIKIFESATIGVDLINHQKDIFFSVRDKFSRYILDALDRGITIREIACSQDETDFAISVEKNKIFNEYQNYALRKIIKATPAIMMLKDKKELFLATSTRIVTNSQPFLWSNNPILVKIVQDWYNSTWDKAMIE